jgi:hypothetical protein
VQVFLERDEPKVLPIPYWTEGEPERRFFNLKRDPSLARDVRELAGCAELRAFVASVNGPASRFATLGCDHWIKPATEPGLEREAGLYVDLVADRLEAATRRRCLGFFERLKRRAASGPAMPGARLTVVRVQPQRVAFSDLGPETEWMLSVWVFGAGSSDREAAERRRHGLAELAAVCDAVSREVAERDGVAGTPIPP